jgi:hypothetical protein
MRGDVGERDGAVVDALQRSSPGVAARSLLCRTSLRTRSWTLTPRTWVLGRHEVVRRNADAGRRCLMRDAIDEVLEKIVVP